MEEKRLSIVLHHDKEDVGTVQIADEVVENIAGIAAMEVEGVHSMGGNLTRELIGKLGGKSSGKGVKIDVLDESVSVSLAIILDYGCSIPEVCRQVQDKVKTSIENMTGLSVIDVNIKIAGVNIEKTK